MNIVADGNYLSELRVNLGSTLSLSSNITGEQGVLSCRWLLYNGNDGFNTSLDLPSAAVSKTSLDLSSSSLIGDGGNFPLVVLLSPSVFVPGDAYVFRLTVSTSLSPVVMYDDIIVVINVPPSQGHMRALPLRGFGLVTNFTLTAVGWVSTSDSYPLHYQFSYEAAPRSFALRIPSSDAVSAEIYSLLPSGTKAFNFTVTLFVKVHDSLNASAVANSSLIVLPAPDYTPLSLLDIVTGSADEYLTSTVISTLNSNSTLLAGIGGYCVTDNDCVSNSCRAFTCVAPLDGQAVCPSSVNSSECSGRGRCLYLNDVGRLLGSCLANNTLCAARCQCDIGYLGAGCEFTIIEFQEQDQVRNRACKNLRNGQLTANSMAILASTYLAGSASANTTTTCLKTLLNITACPHPWARRYYFEPWAQILSNLTEFVFLGQYYGLFNAAVTGLSISDAMITFIQAVTPALYDGMVTSYHASAFDVVLQAVPWYELYNATLRAGESSIALPSSGLDVCRGESLSTAVSVMQWNLNPYSNSSNLVTPLLRLTTETQSQRHYYSNETFFIELPFASTQHLLTKAESPHNYTIPVCQERKLAGSGYGDCGCTLTSFSKNSTVFECLITKICLTPAGPTAQPSFNGASYSTSINTTSLVSFNILETGALLDSITLEIANTFATPVSLNINSVQGQVVMSVVGFWIVLVIGGIIYFHRWDELDRRILLYSKPMAKRKTMTLNEVVELREAIDSAFQERAPITEEQILGEEHVEYHRRRQFFRVARSLSLILCGFFVDQSNRTEMSLLVGGHAIPRFLRALRAFHPLLWFFSNRSMQKTRVIRFITTCKALLLTIFISTILFSIYFPSNSVCSTHTDPGTCLSVPSKILSGQSECGWDASQRHCYVEPPPRSASFVISVSIITTVLMAPFDLLFYAVLNMVCNRQPAFDRVTNILSSGSNYAYYSARYTGTMELEVSVREEELVISTVLNIFRLFISRQVRGQATSEERRRIEHLMSKFGLRLINGDVQLGHLSSYRFNSVRQCIGHHIRKAKREAHSIIENTLNLPDSDERSRYLLQMYILEHFDPITQLSLRRQFLHFLTDRPILIHPFPWILGWIFELTCVAFFIFWILTWGSAATMDSVSSWSKNFGLSILLEVVLVSLIRIFLINLFVVETARPMLRRIHMYLTRLLETDKSLSVDDGNSAIYFYISPSLVASRDPFLRDVSSGDILRRTNDAEEHQLFQRNLYATQEFEEEQFQDVLIREQYSLEPERLP